MSTVGPQLPPHLQKRKRSASPPSPASPASPTSPPSAPPPPTNKRPRLIGPTIPPSSLSPHPSPSPSPSSSSSSSIGPSLPTTHSLPPITAPSPPPPTSAPPKPQREEWMLIPPSPTSWTTRIDPTKLRSRKFAQKPSGGGKSSSTAEGGGGGGGNVSGIWTETPEEKRVRLGDEMMGRVSNASGSSGAAREEGKGRVREAEDEEMARRIREYNEKRGGSLLKAHQGRKGEGKGEEEDDPSKRAFDREKDLALGGRIGEGKKREMVRRAGEFGGRFERGRYL